MLSLVGVGGAGSKVVDQFYKKDLVGTIFSRFSSEKKDDIIGIAIDTSDFLESLKNIPLTNRVMIGKSRAKGHGTGGNVRLGKAIAQEELEIAIATFRKAHEEKPELIFLITGLGGGTGTGGASLIARRLKNEYKVPIIGFYILPSRGEGIIKEKNALSNFDEAVGPVDGAFVLSNNSLAVKGEDILACFKEINETIYNMITEFDPVEISRAVLGKIGTFGFLKEKSNHLSLKDAISKILRDKIYMDLENSSHSRFYLFVKGDMDNIYGEKFAREWINRRFDTQLEIIFLDQPNSKYLNIGLLITDIRQIMGGFEEETVKEKQVSEIEQLLGDIDSI